MKYCTFILIVGLLCYSVVDTNNDFSNILKVRRQNLILYRLLRNFFTTCDLDLKKIIIYDRNFYDYSFAALSDTRPQISGLLFTHAYAWELMGRYQFNDLEVDAVIIFIKLNNAWNMMKIFFRQWRFNRDCIVYIFPIPPHDCDDYQYTLELIMRFYFPKSYFICFKNKRIFYIHTHDPYGDTEPPNWRKIDQYPNNNWTFYGRSYKKELSELCSGFNFERTDPDDNPLVISGLLKEHINQKLSGEKVEEQLFFEDVEEFFTYDLSERVNNLKRLLKLRFMYHMIVPDRNETIADRAYEESGIDAIILGKAIMIEGSLWNYFHPVTYESYAIISHDQGLMTPLEKIAKFYGVWTLSSLIVIIMTTFIVIWISTKNISLAAFDIVRLLINTGIFVPINTRALTVFFSMIFLYFLIIHALFSGHLAEFLTKVDRRHNVETLNDLKDPRVDKIYRFGYRYDDAKEFDILRQKSKRISIWTECKEVVNNPNSACIAPLSVVNAVWINANDTKNTYHISKNMIGLSLLGYSVRPGFPLRDKFNWAIMVLFDTGIIGRIEKRNLYYIEKKIGTQVARADIHHRPISIQDLHFALVLLITGHCAGAICFLLEIGYNVLSKKIKNRHRLKNGNRLIVLVQSNQ